MSNPDLSIIIPAYNEEARLPPSIRQISSWAKEAKDYTFEVVVVVEKSNDATLQKAREEVARCENGHLFRVIDNIVHRGKGFAVRSGFLQARGRWRMFMDADLSVPLANIDNFIKMAKTDPGIDVIIGVRRAGGEERGAETRTWLRAAGSKVFNLFLRLGGLTEIPDTQCGFKLFGPRCSEIYPQMTLDGFGFDVELLLLAKSHQLTIKQELVDWADPGGSRLSPLRDGLGTLWEVIRFQWRGRRHRP